MRPDRRAIVSAYALLKTTGLPGYVPLFLYVCANFYFKLNRFIFFKMCIKEEFNEEYENQIINEEYKIWKKNTPFLCKYFSLLRYKL